MPSTLGFTVSEHWAPFNFRYSAALPRFGHPHSQNASDITGDAHITVTAPSRRRFGEREDPGDDDDPQAFVNALLSTTRQPRNILQPAALSNKHPGCPYSQNQVKRSRR